MAEIFIGIGSNIDRSKHVKGALLALENEFGALLVSSVFESRSVGFDGNNFYNLVVAVSTQLPVLEIAGILKGIEIANGRKRNSKKFSDRTLDLDLLLYDDLIIDDGVQIPRKEITCNAFVLQPLAEIAPSKVHPVEKRTYHQLWEDFDKSTQQLWKVNL